MVLESVLLRGLPTRTTEFVKQLPPFPPQDLALKAAGSGDAQPLGQSRLFSRGTTHTRKPSPPSALLHPHFLGHWLSPQSNRSCCLSGQSNAGSTPARKQILGKETPWGSTTLLTTHPWVHPFLISASREE